MGSVPDSFVEEESLSVILKHGICIAGKRSVPSRWRAVCRKCVHCIYLVCVEADVGCLA